MRLSPVYTSTAPGGELQNDAAFDSGMEVRAIGTATVYPMKGSITGEPQPCIRRISMRDTRRLCFGPSRRAVIGILSCRRSLPWMAGNLF